MVFGGQIGKMEDFENEIVNWRTLVPYGVITANYKALTANYKAH